MTNNWIMPIYKEPKDRVIVYATVILTLIMVAVGTFIVLNLTNKEAQPTPQEIQVQLQTELLFESNETNIETTTTWSGPPETFLTTKTVPTESGLKR